MDYDWSLGMAVVLTAIIIVFTIILLSPMFYGDKCKDSDATQACSGKYGVCMDGWTCMVACQKMADTLNKSVYCECPCETCKTPYCFRVNITPKEGK